MQSTRIDALCPFTIFHGNVYFTDCADCGASVIAGIVLQVATSEASTDQLVSQSRPHAYCDRFRTTAAPRRHTLHAREPINDHLRTIKSPNKLTYAACCLSIEAVTRMVCIDIRHEREATAVTLIHGVDQ